MTDAERRLREIVERLAGITNVEVVRLDLLAVLDGLVALRKSKLDLSGRVRPDSAEVVQDRTAGRLHSDPAPSGFDAAYLRTILDCNDEAYPVVHRATLVAALAHIEALQVALACCQSGVLSTEVRSAYKARVEAQARKIAELERDVEDLISDLVKASQEAPHGREEAAKV